MQCNFIARVVRDLLVATRRARPDGAPPAKKKPFPVGVLGAGFVGQEVLRSLLRIGVQSECEVHTLRGFII